MDSSALIKRYHNEKGTNQVDILFDTLVTRKPRCMVTSIWSIPETIATLNRKKNEGKIDLDRFKELLANFFHEIDMIEIIPVDTEKIINSIPFIMEHNLNSADALHLSAIKDAGEIADHFKGRVIVVTSDKRLLKVSKEEGFETLNPEEIEPVTVQELIKNCAF